MGGYISFLLSEDKSPLVLQAAAAATPVATSVGVVGLLEQYVAQFPEGFWPSFALSTAFFAACNHLLPRFIERIIPAVSSLEPKKKALFCQKLSSLIHHGVCGLGGAALIFRQYNQWRAGEEVDFTSCMGDLVPFISGYITADTVAEGLLSLRAFVKGSKGHAHDMFLHHVLALAIISVAASKPSIMRYSPAFFVTESSSFFLSLMWLLDNLGKGDSTVAIACKLLFSTLFFVTRVLHLPLVCGIAFFVHPESLGSLGATKWLIPPVLLLQFFWFSKIFRKLMPLLRSLLPMVSRGAGKAKAEGAAAAAAAAAEKLKTG